MNNLEIGNIKIDNFIVTAFVTHDTPYELELATHLLPSLEKFRIPHHIEIIEDKGSWIKNVAEKPATIYRVLEKYPSQNVVALDVDSEICEYPKLFNEIPKEYDIALHILDWDKWYGYSNHVKEMLSGTIFLRNNDKVKKIVKQWYEEAINSHLWEQKCLEKIILNNKDIKIYELPIEYCWITTLPDGREPLIESDNIVIKHFSASRKYKKWRK